MKLTLEQIAHWCSGELRSSASPAHSATGYSIDSRTLNTGDLFFAIKGERFDGHDFTAEALSRGAVAAVVARSRLSALQTTPDQPMIVVDDTLVALQQLASSVRRHWAKRVVGVTGSAGKTTTKEAIAAVLGVGYSVLKSRGNLNNNYGLPLQLLRLEPSHDVAVIEMGMNHAGEIAELARIAAPDWGVVTNVGRAHIENFCDGIAGIARAKYELVQALPADGIAFLNCDDPYVAQFGRDFPGRVIHFGRGPCANLRVEQLENLGLDGVRFTVSAEGQRVTVHVRLLGEHNVSNVLAALAVGCAAEIPLDMAARALESLLPEDKRGEVFTWHGATIVHDSYNSNPEALKAMIATLAGMPARRHILVAGEMLELGAASAALHAACGRAAVEAGINVVIGVRGAASGLVETARKLGAEAIYLETPEDAGAWLRDHLVEGDAVLLKASRGVRLERAVHLLLANGNDSARQEPGV